MRDTIMFYNENAIDYCEATVGLDMSVQYNMFEKRLGDGAHILDLGCGSGRDSKHFIEMGYKVTAVDGSIKMCEIASKYTGLSVNHLLFQDMDYENKFDGVFACASLLHLDSNSLISVIAKISKSLKDHGIAYLSFKYGEFEGVINDRYYIDMTEERLTQIMEYVPDLKIQEINITNDIRPDNDCKWLNAIIVKTGILYKYNERNITCPQDNLTGSGTIVLDDRFNKVLIINKKSVNNFTSVLAYMTQAFNISNIASSIESKAEYVVQIPAKFQARFERGELFLNKNKKTGIEWPALMKKAENGRNQFVADLPIEQKRYVQGNPIRDLCESMNNILVQKQLSQIDERLTETYEVVKRVEIGQQDDRISYIETGKKQILLAMTYKDEKTKKDTLNAGMNNLLIGTEQVGMVLKRRVNEYEPIPSGKIKRLIKASIKKDYLGKKDDEVGYIQNCYYTYIEATRIAAAVCVYQGENDAAKRIYDNAKSFLESIDFSNVKSISLAHKNTDFSNWFFNNAIDHIKNEEKECLESSNKYDYYQLEITGEELLEGYKDGE